MAPRRSGRPFPQGARGITTPGMAQSEECSPPNNQQQQQKTSKSPFLEFNEPK